ncbi:MAG: hypothetical protein JNK50_04730 [Bacteroidia bacterium]|nr:hypothetical protein [Bacteroidia bacterium]
MSSLFNYELDEKNIRSSLLNARHNEFSEAAWRDFEENYCKEVCNKNSTLSFIKLPEINLNINRNIVLPIFFILALVGVSAILLSFIDFKPDQEQVEKKLDPNPNNFKATIAPEKMETKQEVVSKPEPKAIAVKKDSIVSAPVIQNPQVVISTPVATMATGGSNINSARIMPATTNAIIKPTSDSLTAQTTVPRIRRKKKEKVPAEQIETIKAPDLMKVETETTEAEPELEIKLD